MKKALGTFGVAALASGPALAASGEYGFFSLRNTDFVVLLGFLLFIQLLLNSFFIFMQRYLLILRLQAISRRLLLR